METNQIDLMKTLKKPKLKIDNKHKKLFRKIDLKKKTLKRFDSTSVLPHCSNTCTLLSFFNKTFFFLLWFQCVLFCVYCFCCALSGCLWLSKHQPNNILSLANNARWFSFNVLQIFYLTFHTTVRCVGIVIVVGFAFAISLLHGDGVCARRDTIQRTMTSYRWE